MSPGASKPSALREGITLSRVGGAVRDELLGYPFDEVDWVVVGANPNDLLDAGFKKVGSDFPVFLHPDTNEEYALARTERKSGKGYNGFTVYADPSVTLEEDLQRRDLTINAMARSEEGELIDPYGGQQDLEAKQLRHVSASFTEDPLRVLRVCRFAARYHHLGFEVASETMDLMREMTQTGELAELAPDRVWRETERALCERNPEVFFRLLHILGADEAMYPLKFAEAALSRLADACEQFDDSLLRWAALTGGDFLPALSYRAAIPKKHLTLSNLVLTTLRSGPPASSKDALLLLEQLDSFRQGSLCEDVLAVLGCIDGRFTADDLSRIRATKTIAETISGGEFAAQGLKGTAIKEAVRQKRIAATADLF
jgi:tRNA nucleotidyltransferase (CCA-adding enzyme)